MRRFLFVAVLCIVMPWLTNAQTLTNKERRQMNMRLHDAIRTYERFSSISDTYARYDFLDLFEGNSTRIYCDLMDYISEDHKIDVATYVDRLSKMQSVDITIKEVSKSEPRHDSDGWHTVVMFKKTINCLDTNGVWFSSEEHYGADHNISVEFVYNITEDRCYIIAIDGEMISTTGRSHLPEKFVVVQKPNKENVKFMLKGGDDSLQFNSFGQTFATSVKEVIPVNYNYRLKKPNVLAQTENYDLVEIRTAPTRWRVKFRYAYALGGIYHVSSPVEFSEQSSSATEMGVDVGFAFSLGRGGSQMGFYTGVSLQESNISFGIDNVDYTYNIYSYTPGNGGFNSDDLNNQINISRKYDDIEIREAVNYKDLVVPAYIAFDHRFGNGLAFTWSVGAKFYFNSSSELDPYHVTGKVTMSDSGVNENIDLRFTEFMYPSYYSHDQAISLIGGAGFNINLFKRMILLSVKANYEYGLENIHTSEENNIHSWNSSGGREYPLIYSQSQGKDIATRSFLDCVSYKRQAIWLEGGLIFKF